jgi:hypothetical protein
MPAKLPPPPLLLLLLLLLARVEAFAPVPAAAAGSGSGLRVGGNYLDGLNTSTSRTTTTTTTTSPPPGASAERSKRLPPTASAVQGPQQQAPDDPVEQERALQKRRLLNYVSQANRGFSSSPATRRKIFSAIEALEAMNPSPRPNDGFSDGSSPLVGDWNLLFTDAADILSLALLPGIIVGDIQQNIGQDRVVFNIVELLPLSEPLFQAFVGSTCAKIEVAATVQTDGPTKLNLRFDSTSFRPMSLLGRDVSRLPSLGFKFGLLGASGVNVGYLDHSYVDATTRLPSEDIQLRIARAPTGNVFVLVRASS